MNEQERKDKAKHIYSKMENLLSNLYCRWLDEHEYENFEDYSDAMKREITKLGGCFIRAFKRPFGCTFILADAHYKLSITSSQYEYKRIK